MLQSRQRIGALGRLLDGESSGLCFSGLTLQATALFFSLGSLAFAADLEAPKILGGNAFPGVVLKRPEMNHTNWTDFNKNGKKDGFEDSSMPVEKRVKDLLARMSLEEKLGQLWQRPMLVDSLKADAKFLSRGELGSYLGADPASPNLRNSLQRVAVEESRLGIPLVFGFDTIHGFRTIFPIPVALSCSWDPSLVECVCAVAARESRAVGVDWTFAPMVDIARDPRWGRIAEGNGEDPWLGSRFAEAEVRGFQGSIPIEPGHVAACLKHYVGYGAAEGGRDYNTTEIGLPTLRNVYLPPFKAGVDAGALSLMSAFNCLNGIPTSGNHFTLSDVLRGEWNFSGMVVSDYESVLELVRHGYAEDESEAARLALTAGVDMEMVSETYRKNVAQLISDQVLTTATLDEAVRRVLRFKFRCGMFEHPYAVAVENPFLRADALALALEAAAQSAVLVKNTNAVLPLKPGLKIALVGPYADSHDLIGCWHGVGQTQDVVTIAAALGQAIGSDRLVVAGGSDLFSAGAKGLARVEEAVGQGDVVVLAIGETSDMSGEASSRQTLGLPPGQEELASRVFAMGKPVVVVLFTGRPLAVPDLLDRSAAMLIAWHPGVQGGPAIADLLTGKREPVGRLTTSWPRALGQIPIHYNHLATSRTFTDKYGSHYIDGSRSPLLPFGFGLGYSSFSATRVKINSTHAAIGEPFEAKTVVRNVGKQRGSTVVQLYIRDYAASGGVRPVRELKGFKRLVLDPDESREVVFDLDSSVLGYWIPDGKWKVEPGRFGVWIGLDSTVAEGVDFKLTASHSDRKSRP